DIPAPATLARRILVTPGDLPPGFVVVGEPPPEGSDADGGFVRCLGAEAPTLKAAVRARSYSGELAKDGAGSVSSSAVAFDSPASATRVVDILSSPSARDCFEEVINERLSRNPALPASARGTLDALDVGVLGEGATGFRFEVTLPAEAVAADPSEGAVPYIGDFYFVRRDRALAVLEFGNLRRPFSPEDARAVAMSVIGRAG
ncbi:MAG: hypothetical protein ACRDY7_01880, partial [Acidimicrobiia bacterium]